MNRLLLILTFILAGCSSQSQPSLKIALIRGETLNVRNAGVPAPNEVKVAMTAMSEALRPFIKFISRNRALELFDKKEVNLVVSGQAADFPAKYKSFLVKQSETKAAFMQLENEQQKILSAQDIYKMKASIAILKDSSFGKYFVKNLGSLSLIIVADFREALNLLKKGAVAGVVVDSIAVKHVGDIATGVKFTELEFKSEPIFHLDRRKYKSQE